MRHVVEVEKALAKAIEESATCVPKAAGGGTIQYVADVRLKKKSLNVTTSEGTPHVQERQGRRGLPCFGEGNAPCPRARPPPRTRMQRYKMAITAS